MIKDTLMAIALGVLITYASVAVTISLAQNNFSSYWMEYAR